MRAGEPYTVFGAGSVGTVLAGLLADAGVDVHLAGRGAVPDLVLEGDDETVRAQVPVVERPVGTILLCVREPDVAGVCRQWRGRTVVTLQNGVASEATAARWCEVIGGVWRFTCTLAKPGVARFTHRGRVVVERHEGTLAQDLVRAGLDVGVSDRIAQDKWLKLCANLGSAPNALIRRTDHARPAFGALKARLLVEARAVLATAGIEARSCDGKDPSLDEEIERQRRAVPRARPVYNAVWRCLSRGRRPRENHHATIVELAARVGVTVPCNAAVGELLERARAPERLALDDVLSAAGR